VTTSDEKSVYNIAGGEVCIWVEKDGPVMLKAVSGSDPVELHRERRPDISGDPAQTRRGERRLTLPGPRKRSSPARAVRSTSAQVRLRWPDGGRA